MHRRRALQWLGAAALGLNPFAIAKQPIEIEVVPTKSRFPETYDGGSSNPRNVICRVIGVGDAGCSIVAAAWLSCQAQPNHANIEFACISMGRQRIRAVTRSNKRNPEIAPIKTVQIGRYGAGNKIAVAIAAARSHQRELDALIDGTEIVILVAGVGGGTGSGVTPMLAKMAQQRGALTQAIVVTPFDWEFGRDTNLLQAIKELESKCHSLVTLSNQEVGDAMGEDAMLDDVFTHQKRAVAACIQRFMLDGSRHFIDHQRGSA